MSSFTVIRHVPLRHGAISFPLQLNVSLARYGFYLLFTIFFKTALTHSCFCLGG